MKAKDKTLLSEAEYLQVMRMAVTGKPQTKEALVAVIHEAEKMRVEAHLLELILEGQLCMYQNNGKMMMRRVEDDDKSQRRTPKPKPSNE